MSRPARRTARSRSRAGATSGRLAAWLLPAAAVRTAYGWLLRCPPGGAELWARTNHRGEPVTLLAGPAVAAAAVMAPAVAGLDGRTRAAMAAAGTAAAAFGCYDDLAGSATARGFRGHLGGLARGELTSGAVKLLGIGAAALASASLLGGPPADAAVNGGLIAGTANLVNLFDLRPGRAIKVTVAGAALLVAGTSPRARAAASRAAAVPAGAALALLPGDLAERSMLGDAGANALGAMLGVTAAGSLPRGAKITLLAAVAALTAASEVVSFTSVIERTPVLRWLDMLGRRPVTGEGADGQPAGAAPGPPVPGPPVPRPPAAGPTALTAGQAAAGLP